MPHNPPPKSTKAKVNCMDNQCCKERHVGRWARRQRCTRKGSVERDGKLYCKIHDPVLVEEKRNKRNAEYQAKWDKEAEEREYVHLAVKHCKKLGLTIEDLKKEITYETTQG